MSDTRNRAAFNGWARSHLSPETAANAERLADLLSVTALPALDTLLRDTYRESRDKACADNGVAPW